MDNDKGKEEKSLALEILEEVKAQSNRWMAAFFVALGLWAATIAGFIWYIYQYDYANYEVESNDGGNANFIGRDGDITNGTSQGADAD